MTDVKLKPLYPHMAHRNKQIITPNAGKSATGAKRGKICDRCQTREKLRPVPNAGKSATGAKRGKIRVRQVTSDVAWVYPRLPEKENKRDTQCLL